MRSCHTILLLLLLSVTAMAQTTLLDFEGAAPTFEDFNGSATTFVANPDMSDPNTSANVAQNVIPSMQNFAGIKITQNVDLGAGKSFTMQVWSPIENAPVLLKFEGSATGPDIERPVNFTGAANSWQELTFDFASEGDHVYPFVVVFMNFNVNTNADPITFYWDNLVQSGGSSGPSAPQTAAPTPPDPADQVVSIYSDTYDDVMVDTYRTDWSMGDLLDTMIDGNATLKYSNLDFIGIETTTNPVDLTAAGVNAMHIDYWSANGTFFGVKLVDFGADGVFGGGDDVEHQIDFTDIVPGEWNSIDFALEDFTGLTTQSNIAQYVLVGQPTGANDIYIDNIYFYFGTGLDQQMELPVTFDDPNVDYGLSGFGGSNGSIVADPEDATNMVGQVVKDAGAMTWAGVTLTSTSGGPDAFATAIPFAADATIITARVWSPAAGTNVLLKAEQTDDNTVSVETNAMTTVAGGWETLTFDFANHADGTAALNLDAVYGKLSIFPGFGDSPAAEVTYYFDDVIFTGEGGGVTGPMTAAPTPTRDAADVISLFSDAYTNVTVDTFLAGFSNGVLTDTMVEGNATLLYSNLNFAGIETIGDNAIDLVAAGMTHLHLNFWSANSTAFRTKLVDFGGDGFGNGNDTEFEIERNLAQGEWVTVEYPLSAFSGMNQSDINQLIISSAPADLSNVWIDNIYFYKGEDIGTQMDLPVTFDEEGVDYGLAGFGGSDGAVVEDPTDATNTVGQVVKGAGAMTWAGATMTSTAGGPDGFASRIPFAADATTITVRTWSPAAGITVRLKAEKTDDQTVSVETEAMTTVASDWETLTFDFSNEADGTAALDLNAVYAKLSIFFDFGNMPTEAATYYFDDVIFDGDGGGGDDVQMDLPVTFDEEGVDYGLAGFGGADGSVVVDPTDASNMVGQLVKGAGAMTWAGATMTSTNGGPDGFATAIPFAADATSISVRTWSPAAGINVLLKAEQTDDGSVSVETSAMTTVAEGWEILVFDFSDEAAGTPALDLNAVYGKLSIFFDFGNMPTEEATYYFDDVIFGDVVGTNEPITGILEAFPNPVGEAVNIIAPERMQSLTLFSITGQVVGKWVPNTEQFSVEMGHLPTGNYVALVRTEQGLLTIKLLKQ